MKGNYAQAGAVLLGAVLLMLGFLAGRLTSAESSSLDKSGRYEDWYLSCPTPRENMKPCEFSQDILDPKSNAPIASLVVALEQDRKTLRLKLPDDALLEDGVGLILGANGPRAYPFSVCDFTNCFALAPMDASLLGDLTSSQEGRLVYVGQDKKPVTLPFSLRGFSEADNAFEANEVRRRSWWRRLWS